MINKTKIMHSMMICALLIISILLVNALSFQSNPAITPNPAFTDDDLVCSWVKSADTTQTNVSWYKNNVLMSTTTTTENSSTLPNENTTKNEVWKCNVTIKNATSTLSRSTTRTISNSPPGEPTVYNATGDDMGTSQTLLEDETYTYDINSSDADNDIMTYRVSPDDSFCTLVDENTGAVTCSPTTDDLGDNNTEGTENITFWADDTDAFNPRSTGHTIQFTITPVNDEPYFNPAITDQTAYEDTPFTYNITGVDEEDNDFNFTMTSDLGNRLIMNITSNTTAQITFNTSNGAPDWEDRGNYTVTITVWETNDSSVNTTETFNLEVVPVNQVPVITTYSSVNGTQGELFTFWINATDVNENDTLTFELTAPLCDDNPWEITTVNDSANATGLINMTLNNSHVVCRNVTITVSDGVASDSIDLNFSIININDPPEIYNISYYDENSGANSDLNNLWGATGLTFSYRVNATDIDMLTYENDTMTFATNNSNFSINASTGLISFVPNSSLIGNWSVLVNVTDLNGSFDTAVMSIRIINNTAPNITEVTIISCREDFLCSGYISAVDPDPDDNLTFTSNNTALFDLTYYNTTASEYSFIPDNDDVGNYSILVNVTDMVGATDNMTFILQINNTNDAPFFDNDLDETEDTLVMGLLVENQTIPHFINATDVDIPYGDNITFDVEFLIGNDLTLFNITKYSNNTGLITFTPNSSQTGFYSANFSVTDSEGAVSWQIVNFTVHNASATPIVTEIMPYWDNISEETVFDEYGNASLFENNTVSISFDENITIEFNAHFTDNDSADENITFYWYYDGELNQSITASDNTTLNMTFDFFTAGVHNISLKIEDNYYSYTWWNWTLDINNINRAPLLLNDPDNRTDERAINSQITLLNYLGYYDTEQRFIDPDDDLNSNNEIRNNVSDPYEVNHLNYTITDCSVATFSISSDDLTISPSNLGTCVVNITASDGEYNVTSYNISIEVIYVPPSTSGSTSTSRTRTITESIAVPIPQEVQKPVMVKIITPTTVTIYKNKTMVIPIRIRNNWNSTLYGIRLSAIVNESDAQISLSTETYASLVVGQEEKFNLTVTNYREDGPYEIQITANVTEPPYYDVATILVNAIESRDRGEEVDIKITFAMDLLTQNAECQELNELLDIAREKASAAEYDEALEYVDKAINGCKYLMSRKELESQKQTPKSFASMLGDNMLIVKMIAVVFGILGLGVLIYTIVDKVKERKKNKAKT